jgi:hypothetical protein
MMERGAFVQVYVEMALRANEHAAGRVNLSPSEVFDLDRDRGSGREGWDVGLDRVEGTSVLLSFGNGARAALLRTPDGAASALDASACEAASTSITNVRIADPVSGRIVCVKTTAGRTALIQLGRLTTDPPELGIRYSTSTAGAPETRTDTGRPDPQPGGDAAGRVRMPSLVGQPIRDARDALTKLGLRIRTEYNSVGRAQPDTVFSQRPDAGNVVDRGTVVRLYVEMPLGADEHAAGRLLLGVNEVTQLDRDEEDGRTGWDIAFRGSSGSGYYLEFGARALGAPLRRQPESRSLDRSVCQGVRLSNARVTLAEPATNLSVCVKTTKGRMAVVHLGAVTGDPPELAIRYSTLNR